MPGGSFRPRDVAQSQGLAPSAQPCCEGLVKVKTRMHFVIATFFRRLLSIANKVVDMLQQDPLWVNVCMIAALALILKLYRVAEAGRRYLASEHARKTRELRSRGA
jgi:hypothetical protein